MPQQKIRYAVVGVGHISQVAMLPAFRHAKKNSVLAALVTSDLKKSLKVAKKYADLNPDVEVVSYDDYLPLLDSGRIDAVYIATPNHRHTEFVLPALDRGIHVLCEKPLALSLEECERMGALAEKTGARFMVAYRLHFEPANLRAIDLLKNGEVGNPRYFNSVFSYQLKDDDNIRLKSEMGGGPLWDIGIYCINAARYLFQSEPLSVTALGVKGSDPRFTEVEEMVGAVMKFPDDRIATFVCSFGASAVARFEVYGTRGHIELNEAYEYTAERELILKLDERNRKKTFKFKKGDQFAPELIHFSDCVLKHKQPGPGMLEGLADVRIIRALHESLATGQVIELARERKLLKKKRPKLSQKLVKPPVAKVRPVEVKSPS